MLRLGRLFRKCNWFFYFLVVFSVSAAVWNTRDTNITTQVDERSADVKNLPPVRSVVILKSETDLSQTEYDENEKQQPEQLTDNTFDLENVDRKLTENNSTETIPAANTLFENENANTTTPQIVNQSVELASRVYPKKKVWSFSPHTDKSSHMSESLYSFQPHNFTDDELEGKDTMDYVKGLGYWYIYNNATHVDQALNRNLTEKTILLWNSFYDDADYKFGIGRSPFKVHLCKYYKCRTTIDRSELKTADMVIFFIFGLDYTKPGTVPERGHPDQIYVFWNHESPFYKTKNKLRRFRNVFNLTVSYRMDSSIALPLYQTRARVQRKLHPQVTKYHLRHKTKLAVWMISACHKIGSLRLPYEKELERYIPVDTYGACGDLSCPMNETQTCLDDMEKTYKFYLAFENSMCKDYITEKAYRTLYGNWVPVVMGGGDYVKHLPPHSFIDVRDFESPRHLAEYLVYLDQNDEEYLKYFEWKKDWIVWRVHTKVAMCELCEMLHIGSEKIRSDLDIHQWWEVDGACVIPSSLPKYLNLSRS